MKLPMKAQEYAIVLMGKGSIRGSRPAVVYGGFSCPSKAHRWAKDAIDPNRKFYVVELYYQEDPK